MSTADTALSISVKMAPGPEHRQEPVAPDKIAESERAAADAAVDADNSESNTLTTTSGGNSNNNGNTNNNNANESVVAEQSANVEIAPANFAAGADPVSQGSPPNSGADSKQVSIADCRGNETPKNLIDKNFFFFPHVTKIVCVK